MKLHNYYLTFLVSIVSWTSASYTAAQNPPSTVVKRKNIRERTVLISGNIKKAKLYEGQIPTSTNCDCACCCKKRSNASELHDRDYTIAKALLLATPLPHVLTDMIYDYAGYSLHPKERRTLRSEEHIVSGRADGEQMHAIQLKVSDNVGKGRKIIHVVPQEVSFDSDSLKEAGLVVFGTTASGGTPRTIRSRCERYCLIFLPQAIIISSFSSKLSASSGWQLALEELKKVAEK